MELVKTVKVHTINLTEAEVLALLHLMNVADDDGDYVSSSQLDSDESKLIDRLREAFTIIFIAGG